MKIDTSGLIGLSTNVLVVGPSGVGKTHLSQYLRQYKIRSMDLDFVGYRNDESDWTEWVIPPGIIDVLSEGPRAIAVGACSNADALIKKAIGSGWSVVFLTSTASNLKQRRQKRGDSEVKVEHHLRDLLSWNDRYESYRQLGISRIYEMWW